jgi:hypothetical protein
MKAATVLGWHRKGFGLFWTWKIHHGRAGRPSVPKDVRELIRTMSRDNPLRGAPRIHGELLKLGIDVGETSVSKYMVPRRKPPSQTWRTFLDIHLNSMVSVDFFVVPTIRFETLYVFLVLAHDRRRIVHFGVTKDPTAEWTAQQFREAFPWDKVPRYLLRDRDRNVALPLSRLTPIPRSWKISAGLTGRSQRRRRFTHLAQAQSVRTADSGVGAILSRQNVKGTRPMPPHFIILPPIHVGIVPPYMV